MIKNTILRMNGNNWETDSTARESGRIEDIYNDNWITPKYHVQQGSSDWSFSRFDKILSDLSILVEEQEAKDRLDQLEMIIGTSNITEDLLHTGVQNGTFSMSEYLTIKTELGL